MTKRMVLVDERVYNEMHPNKASESKLELFQKILNDDLWKRTPTETSKSHLSNNLESQLDSTDVPDDVKAKLYQKTLKRFLNLKQQVPELESGALNAVFEKTKKRRKPKNIQWEPLRQSKRPHKKWSRYDNE
jgi:tRNA C32,U32 (ribose-2'-O)-methylase TrmJ